MASTVGAILDRAQRDTAGAPVVESGIITVRADGTVLVNTAGTDEVAKPAVDIDVASGDVGMVVRLRGRPYIICRVSGQNPVPGQLTPVIKGRVTSVPAGSSTISVDVAAAPLPFVVAYTATAGPAVGDAVATMGGVVIGKMGSTPPAVIPKPPAAVRPPPPKPPAPPPVPRSGMEPFTAIDAGSFRNGKWRTDSGVVAQGDWGGYGVNTGAWFYGSAPSARLGGATVTKCEVRLSRQSGGVWAAQDAIIYGHGSRTRPAGNVTLSGAAATHAPLAVNGADWFDVPAAIGQAMVDAGGGIAISAGGSTPYVVCRALATDPASGQVRIYWSR